ncbi:MAG: SDR family oxidoreductase [Gammaproteobacteria bacterium]|jgi:NAD(P)-dependent dehydrogenase (short-subunit alcohol dehydrogenase family)|nr:SDR family oxidoreductase [Gammaproteobacteria bacterium]
MEERQRLALVTGATGGIGRATAARLAAVGYRLALHYHRRATEAARLADGLPGGPHFAVGEDLAASGAGTRLVAAVTEKSEKIDIIVNNAAIFVDHAPQAVTLDEWQRAWSRTLAINLVAAADIAFAALPHFPPAGGKIINVSSRGAYRGEPEAPAYGASKAALNSLTQSLARALGSRGILVYGVAPGWVETDMAAAHLDGPHGEAIRAQSPLNRAARPGEVAGTIAFLAGDDTDFLTGAIIDVNGASYCR